jgi:hypothetical protein
VERRSTEVQITQKQKTKEETLTEKIKRPPDKGTHKHTEAEVIHFDNHICLSQSVEIKCIHILCSESKGYL